MNHQDTAKFAKIMVTLGEYYGREISDGLIDTYWRGLSHLEIDEVREALNRHMQNPDAGQFMPKIADIARMVAGSTQSAALIAWSKVDRGVRSVGVYESVVFDDPLIHRVITDMGGWVAMGNKTEDDWPFVAKEFENRYRGYAMRSERPDYPKVLIGMAEAQNSQLGFKSTAPRLIGEPDRARLVYRQGGESIQQFARLDETSAQVTARLIDASKSAKAA